MYLAVKCVKTIQNEFFEQFKSFMFYVKKTVQDI